MSRFYFYSIVKLMFSAFVFFGFGLVAAFAVSCLYARPASCWSFSTFCVSMIREQIRWNSVVLKFTCLSVFLQSGSPDQTVPFTHIGLTGNALLFSGLEKMKSVTVSEQSSFLR